jgi:hypothetical protein
LVFSVVWHTKKFVLAFFLFNLKDNVTVVCATVLASLMSNFVLATIIAAHQMRQAQGMMRTAVAFSAS